MKDIVAANRDYERWLKAALVGEIVRADLTRKHAAMGESAFAFLRATYWRWAETILTVCPDLAEAPRVLAVGDIHLENFGTWTDDEGRICWGVNDYDEAAEMPYILDLVRLAASAVLALFESMPLDTICRAIVDGYKAGLDDPRACVLDRDHLRIRRQFVLREPARRAFWTKIGADCKAAASAKAKPGRHWLDVFRRALPEPGIALTYWPHTAGTGSLGRPRWLGYGEWRGGPVLREAKALVVSGWVRAQGGSTRLRIDEIAGGKYRSPDPWYAETGGLLVRRKSPNNRKVELERRSDAARLLHPKLLDAMGRDLAAIHLGTGDRSAAIARDLAARKPRAFRAEVQAAADLVRREFAAWKKAARRR